MSTPTFAKDLSGGSTGCTDIYVSKWTEDGNVNIRFGGYGHETVINLEPHMADRLGWALLRANAKTVMPNDGEPDRDNP